MFNKNTISSILLIASLLFLFFHDYGILTLMKKQSSIHKQEKKIDTIKSESKKIELENKRMRNLEDENHSINIKDIKKLDDLRKEKGFTSDNEHYYIISPE